MKLYYAPGACSLADHIALIEAGLPYSLVKVDLKSKRTENGVDFSTINPKCYVPALALDGNDGVLTENIAILSYIADKSGKLMPASGLPHFRVIEAIAFVSTEIHKNFKPFFSPTASAADKDAARAMLDRRFTTIDEMFDGHAFLVGDSPTIADCYLFVMLTWARKNGLKLPPRVQAFFDRFRERPSVGRALAEEGLNPA